MDASKSQMLASPSPFQSSPREQATWFRKHPITGDPRSLQEEAKLAREATKSERYYMQWLRAHWLAGNAHRFPAERDYATRQQMDLQFKFWLAAQGHTNVDLDAHRVRLSYVHAGKTHPLGTMEGHTKFRPRSRM